MRLNKKIAIITGAGSGMGRAMALCFAREGAIVVIIDIVEKNGLDTAKEIECRGGQAVFIQGDITSKVAVQEFVKHANSKFGEISILVNNAGIVRGAPFLDITENAWETTLSINLKGAFFCVQAVAPQMMARGYGKILNISSRAFLGSVGQADYVASKGGVVSLTRALALELAPYKINVNSIAPGVIQTPLLEKVEKERLTQYLKNQPMGEFGKPEDIAEAALFLCSDEASFITGQTLIIDGGRSIGGLVG
jgi:NAD(P)-dependent dehydrogenase (short-subunit alcohol dehydrogenase family)